ncbi:hypothetical protein PR048_029725 [Dryococelus australis]|uniref:Uncharacterized protein n=1 Tax=Dryococelus australis TaxID=614101 RepID=A0ABQ9GE72_9NEOP|nr:hypothetical protein PR048_029725 [Dryococelus australis]
MNLFTQDFQPFSVVEESGFRSFVAALNPQYSLPDRKTITDSMLPALYEKLKTNLEVLLQSVQSITVTIYCLTSVNVESFLSVTAHFIDGNFQIKSEGATPSLRATQVKTLPGHNDVLFAFGALNKTLYQTMGRTLKYSSYYKVKIKPIKCCWWWCSKKYESECRYTMELNFLYAREIDCIRKSCKNFPCLA